MREIKFRAWDTEEKKWYEPVFKAYRGKLHHLLISFSGDLCAHTMSGIDHESLFPNRYELMQYTGLKDKNGKEIYQGDIVAPGWSNTLVSGVVVYQAPAFIIKDGLADKAWCTFDIYPSEPQVYEVIGNIYENPELLT